jgi:hypothetical protein
MVSKLPAVFGVCLVAAVFQLAGGSVAHQDDSAKRSAIEQMREIADAIKSCPEHRLSHACHTASCNP